MPLLARLEASNTREHGFSPRCNGRGSTPGKGFLRGVKRFVRNNIRSDLEKFRPNRHRGPEAEVPLRGRDIGRQGGDSISRKVMRMEAEVIKEFPSEIAKGKAEPTRKVGHENNILAFVEYRRGFI